MLRQKVSMFHNKKHLTLNNATAYSFHSHRLDTILKKQQKMSSLHIRSQLSAALQLTPKPAGKHTSISTVKFYNTYISNMYEIYKCA